MYPCQIKRLYGKNVHCCIKEMRIASEKNPLPVIGFEPVIGTLMLQLLDQRTNFLTQLSELKKL